MQTKMGNSSSNVILLISIYARQKENTMQGKKRILSQHT